MDDQGGLVQRTKEKRLAYRRSHFSAPYGFKRPLIRQSKEKRHTLRYVFFLGGRSGTLAFSGAPRSTIINCRLCRRLFRSRAIMTAKRSLPFTAPTLESLLKNDTKKYEGIIAIPSYFWWTIRDSNPGPTD